MLFWQVGSVAGCCTSVFLRGDGFESQSWHLICEGGLFAFTHSLGCYALGLRCSVLQRAKPAPNMAALVNFTGFLSWVTETLVQHFLTYRTVLSTLYIYS